MTAMLMNHRRNLHNHPYRHTNTYYLRNVD